ncbi:MAG: FliI/YscN family ATPase [Pseudomonadota bacterium]
MTQKSGTGHAARQIARLSPVRTVGRVTRIEGGALLATGFGDRARIGDRVEAHLSSGQLLTGEVIQLSSEGALVLPEGSLEGAALGDRLRLNGPAEIAPDDSWIGRIIDPSGAPMDDRPLTKGARPRPLRAPPPPPAQRAALGARLETGLSALNTVLPIVKGQRVGLFAGSGVGKSSLLGSLAQNMQADVVVIAMIGERGRELRHFVDDVLGEAGLARAVIVASTSDQSPLQRRRCAWTAMAVAEHFRDAGKSVLLLADSITRFAEAHREIAVAAGEAPVLRGYPPSTSHLIMSLCERAGPGLIGKGTITAVFSVLVAGSDMDEPVADILRGVLDGHIVLSREIAERGRYPAIDVLRSVSRSLPAAASDAENKSINLVRRLLGVYERNQTMITAGLYAAGSDTEIDKAIAAWSEIDDFLGRSGKDGAQACFNRLALLLRRTKAAGQQQPGNPQRPSAA